MKSVLVKTSATNSTIHLTMMVPVPERPCCSELMTKHPIPASGPTRIASKQLGNTHYDQSGDRARCCRNPNHLGMTFPQDVIFIVWDRGIPTAQVRPAPVRFFKHRLTSSGSVICINLIRLTKQARAFDRLARLSFESLDI